MVIPGLVGLVGLYRLVGHLGSYSDPCDKSSHPTSCYPVPTAVRTGPSGLLWSSVWAGDRDAAARSEANLDGGRFPMGATTSRRQASCQGRLKVARFWPVERCGAEEALVYWLAEERCFEQTSNLPGRHGGNSWLLTSRARSRVYPMIIAVTVNGSATSVSASVASSTPGLPGVPNSRTR